MPVKRRATAVGVGVAALAVVAGAVVLLLEKGEHVTGAVEIKQPSDAVLAAVADTRILFGHQSVGANIISGIGPVFEGGTVAAPEVLETREAVPGTGGFLAHAFVGVNGDPIGKFADFTSIVDGPLGSEVDVALLKLCYADIVAATDVEEVFDAYVAMMTELQERHPDVRFLYTTVPVTRERGWKAVLKSWVGIDDQMGPADNAARQRYNALIRQRYGETGRLFDVAAVEATLRESPTVGAYNGQDYLSLNPVLAADSGHLNALGSRAAAAELVRVVAAAR